MDPFMMDDFRSWQSLCQPYDVKSDGMISALCLKVSSDAHYFNTSRRLSHTLLHYMLLNDRVNDA